MYSWDNWRHLRTESLRYAAARQLTTVPMEHEVNPTRPWLPFTAPLTRRQSVPEGVRQALRRCKAAVAAAVVQVTWALGHGAARWPASRAIHQKAWTLSRATQPNLTATAAAAAAVGAATRRKFRPLPEWLGQTRPTTQLSPPP